MHAPRADRLHDRRRGGEQRGQNGEEDTPVHGYVNLLGVMVRASNPGAVHSIRETAPEARVRERPPDSETSGLAQRPLAGSFVTIPALPECMSESLDDVTRRLCYPVNDMPKRRLGAACKIANARLVRPAPSSSESVLQGVEPATIRTGQAERLDESAVHRRDVEHRHA